MDCHEELRQAWAEEEALKRDIWCEQEQYTGDKSWPVLCGKTNRYNTRRECEACKLKRYGGNNE